MDWTLVRPPRLTDAHGATGTIEPRRPPLDPTTWISRQDLAVFLLHVAERGLYVRQAPFAARR